MKQYIFLPIALVATLAALLFTSCTISVNSTSEAIEPGEITKETRKTEAFNKIYTGGSMDVEFVTSDSTYIEIEAGKNVLPHIKTEVYNGKLNIQLDNADGNPFISADKRTIRIQTKNINNLGDIKVKVFAPTFDELYTGGAIDFEADSINTSKEFKVHTAGNSDIHIKQINCTNNAEIKIAGKGDIKIDNITCQNMKIETAGNSDLQLQIKDANNIDISTAGHSSAEITFNNCNRAGVNVAGAANLTFKGTLNILDKHLAGACSIDTDELKLTNKTHK